MSQYWRGKSGGLDWHPNIKFQYIFHDRTMRTGIVIIEKLRNLNYITTTFFGNSRLIIGFFYRLNSSFSISIISSRGASTPVQILKFNAA